MICRFKALEFNTIINITNFMTFLIGFLIDIVRLLLFHFYLQHSNVPVLLKIRLMQ